MLDKPQMLTVQEVADTYRKHPVTVRIALQDGALHGRQRMTGGRWLVEAECADAWSRGVVCSHVAESREPLKLHRVAV